MHPAYETLAEVLNAIPDPNMTFLDKTRPGPKTGQRRIFAYHSPVGVGKPPISP